MNPTTKAVACVLVAMGCLPLAGCGLVDSRHPASDKTDSLVAHELFGLWRSVEEEAKDVQPASDEEPRDEILAVGRLRPQEPTLEVEHVSVGTETGKVKVEKSVALATRIGERTYLSWRSHPEAFDGEDETWVIVRYEMPDRDTLRVHFMDPALVAKEVEAGRLDGRVKREPPKDLEAEKVAVRLSSPTPDIRRFLAERGESVFETKHVWNLRRVR
jgi:hypothetical protein